MKEFDYNANNHYDDNSDSNDSLHNNGNIADGQAYDRENSEEYHGEDSSSDSSDSPYFSYIHEEDPGQPDSSSVSSGAAASGEDGSGDGTYRYNYRQQGAGPNQSDYVGQPSYQRQSYSEQETYGGQQESYTDTNYQEIPVGDSYGSSQTGFSGGSGFHSNTGDKAARKKRKKMEKAARKNGGKKRGYVVKLVASALVFGLVAGAAFQGFNYCYSKINPSKASDSTIQSTPTLQTSGDTVTTTTDVSEMVANAMPAIVSITSVIEQQINYGFWGYQGGTQEEEGAGSGIIIGQNDTELLIATNYHVIEDAKTISVGFCDSKNVDASVKGSDQDADLAVVSVPLANMEDSTKNAVKVATLGKSSDLKVGESAIAIGNALGYGQSVTVGYVSALDREIALTDKTMTLLQTDAAINPGNSGGALLNMKGEVIGINTVKYSDTTVEGMGYAIPIDTAAPIIESLMTEETIPESEQAFLGITGSDVTESYSQQLNLPTGIYVQSVQEGSPAEQGGIYAGDVIVKFEGNSVTTMDSLINKLSRKRAGDKVSLTVKRMNQQGSFEDKELSITLGSKQDMQQTN